MDESFHELEAELKKLQPHRFPSRIARDIAAELSTTAEDQAMEVGAHSTPAFAAHGKRWQGWPLAGLAAAIAVGVTFLALLKVRWSEDPAKTVKPMVTLAAPQSAAHAQPSAPAVADRYQAVAVANVLYDLRDEGPTTTGENTSARLIRYRFLDTYTWKNPQSNASLKWSVPRDEIRVLPVSFN